MTLTFLFSEIIINFFIFLSSIFIIYKINFFKYVKFNLKILIYIYHTIFMIVMIIYTYKNPGDSNFYWSSVDSYEFNNLISSGFMKLILYFFKDLLHISYSNLMLLINLIGSIGIFFFVDFLRSKLPKKKNILIFILIFLPSIHIWTNTFIKESFILSFIFIFIWLEGKTKNRIILQVILLSLLFIIRPYLGIIFIFPYLLRSYFQSSHKIIFLIPLICLSTLIILSLLYFLKYHSLEITTFNPFEIIRYILSRFELIIHGSTFIDTNKFFIINMVSYLFSPIFYMGLSSSPMIYFFLIETFVFLIILSYLLKNFDYKLPIDKVLYLITITILLFIVAETTTNIGIVLRQKWTILIFYLYILVDGQKYKT